MIKRTWIQEFLSSRSKDEIEKMKKKTVLSEAERAQRMARLKQMEIERKKALKAAIKRAKLKRLNALEEEKTDESVSRFSLKIIELYFKPYSF